MFLQIEKSVRKLIWCYKESDKTTKNLTLWEF